MNPTYQSLIDHPELLRQIVAAAKRERALALNRLIFAPLAALFRPSLRMQGCSSQVSSRASASSSRVAALG